MSEIGTVPESTESPPLVDSGNAETPTWEDTVMLKLTDISNELTTIHTFLEDGQTLQASYREQDVATAASLQAILQQNNAELSEIKELLSTTGGTGTTVDMSQEVVLYLKTSVYLLCGVLLFICFLVGFQIFRWMSGFLLRMFDRVP